MFGRRKQAKPAQVNTIPSDAIPFLCAGELLAPHTALLKKIRNDSGASKPFFDTYYMPAIEHLSEYLQLRPFGHDGVYAKKGGAIEVAIKRVALAIKLRLGALLPLNCKPEEIAHRGECWTYGLFVSALMRDFGGQVLGVRMIGFGKNDRAVSDWQGWVDPINKYNHYRMKKVAGISRSLSYSTTVLHVRDIVPAVGLEWMFGDHELLDCVLDILGGAHKIQDNPLQAIISKASSTLRDEISFDSALDQIEKTQSRQSEHKPTSVKERIDTETGEVIPLNTVPDKSTKSDITAEQQHQNNAAASPLAEPPVIDYEQPPQSLEDYLPEPDDEVTAKNLVARLKMDIQKNRIPSEHAKLDGNTIKVKYPSGFRRYTDSPADLMNELRLIGAIEKEGERKGVSVDRVIVLKG